MEDASAVYQHRYGDGSVAISSSINFGSPRQDGLSNKTSIEQFGTRRLETPFGCVLAQRSSLALKPKSVFQRQKERRTMQSIEADSRTTFTGQSRPTTAHKRASNVKLRSSFTKQAADSGLVKDNSTRQIRGSLSRGSKT